MKFRKVLSATLALFAIIVCAQAQDTTSTSCVLRQSLDDAWWTGPMLAPSAATLPQGHFLLEPYFYDVTTQGQYDEHGVRHSAPHANDFGSLTYALYGLTDKFTVGMIPTGGYNDASNTPTGSSVGLGDLTLQGEYRLTQFRQGSWFPTTSIAVQETLPTAKYDHLDRLSDGFGAGAYTTTAAFYSQTYFWLRNGRILRMRFNVVPSFSNSVKVDDLSVYGTAQGFRGHAKPGSSIYVDASWEYSLTRRLVLALDATYRYTANTRVSGYNLLQPDSATTVTSLGISDSVAFAPAIEYSWKHNLGVLLGTRLVATGHNTPATITPAIAINFVH
jgi:hypothetical protein